MADAGGREAARLEELWAGEFGARYADAQPRRRAANARRSGTRSSIGMRSDRCSRSAAVRARNLAPIARRLDGSNVWGVDVSAAALEGARQAVPGANLVMSTARRLPFRDRLVDLAYTVGVLIHQPEESLGEVIDEIVRCSDRFVLWAEYHADRTEEVAYHGQSGSLFRRDYGAVYAGRHPELRIVEEGFLDRDAGFDRVTWQLLERR